MSEPSKAVQDGTRPYKEAKGDGGYWMFGPGLKDSGVNIMNENCIAGSLGEDEMNIAYSQGSASRDEEVRVLREAIEKAIHAYKTEKEITKACSRMFFLIQEALSRAGSGK